MARFIFIIASTIIMSSVLSLEDARIDLDTLNHRLGEEKFSREALEELEILLRSVGYKKSEHNRGFDSSMYAHSYRSNDTQRMLISSYQPTSIEDYLLVSGPSAFEDGRAILSNSPNDGISMGAFFGTITGIFSGLYLLIAGADPEAPTFIQQMVNFHYDWTFDKNIPVGLGHILTFTALGAGIESLYNRAQRNTINKIVTKSENEIYRGRDAIEHAFTP